MSEPVKRATSLQDIGAATVGIKIKRPDGQVVEVALRSATEGELWEIRRSLPKVSPPVKDMTKSGPVYDYQDPGFVAAVEDNNRLFAQRVLLASLVDLAVPGISFLAILLFLVCVQNFLRKIAL